MNDPDPLPEPEPQTPTAATEPEAQTPSAAAAVADLAPAACAARLAALFPAVFAPGVAKPLKLRIQADIQQRAPGEFTRRSLSVFLHRYTTSNAYLRALAAAPARTDLDGQPAGDVSDEHRDAAKAELERRRGIHEARRAAEQAAQREAYRESQRQARDAERQARDAERQAQQARQAEDAAWRERTAIARAFATTTLTRANFCALKRLTEAELDAALAAAKQDQRPPGAAERSASAPGPARAPARPRRPAAAGRSAATKALMRPGAIGRAAALLGALLAGDAAWAWSDDGHEIVAAIAYARMTKAARTAADALLATDKDPLTAPDFVSRSTWADRWRDADRATTRVQYEATRQWHFVNIEIDGGTLAEACNHHPPLPPGVAASLGPARDCVVDKITQFAAELHSAATPPAEKRLALKYLIHFVGDLHQPLHAADRHDAGGNSLPVLWGDIKAAENLHAYWDRELVLKLGHDPRAVAKTLNQAITGAQSRAWGKGKPSAWANESWGLAKTVAYDFSGEAMAPDEHGVPTLKLDAAYEQRALPVLRAQLSRAGLRLARLLDAALK